MLWLYIHFPNLLMDHVRSTRDDPGALVISDARKQLVFQACPEARALGIIPGMRLKTAISLAPELAIMAAAPDRERQVLEQQARWLYRYAAHICLHSPDGVLAEASSMSRLHGGVEGLWRKLTLALEQRQLTGWLAIGQTPRAAQQLARANRGQCTGNPEILNGLLQGLSIAQAGLPERIIERLARVGLLSLGDLMQLPPDEIARRLEPETLQLLQKTQGTRPDPQPAWSPPHRFCQRLDFTRDVEQTSGLLFPLQRVLGELQDDLQWRQQDTDSLLLTLHHRHHPETHLKLRTAGPEHRAVNFLALVRLRLEQQTLAAPVEGMTLRVNRLMPRGQPMGDDLLGDGPSSQEAWQVLISRLQARLGDQALKVLASHEDHRPERAWSHVRPIRPGTVSSSVSGTIPRSIPGTACTSARSRPLWLFNSPEPVLNLPEAWLSGPERISGGWWDGERVQRDYYVAQLTSGQLAWVFRDVSGGWFVHGLFG